MINCPFISSNANWLAQSHRPKSPVRSNPGSRARGANRQQPTPILRSPRFPNVETTNFNLKNNASTVVTRPTDSTLSP